LFYVLSKIFNFFLAPEHWIYIMLVIAFFTKRLKLRRRLLIASFVILLLFGNEAIFNKVANWWQAPRVVLADSSGYSAGILLGGFSMLDKNNQGYLSEAGDRFVQTFLLYKKGVIKKIIVSGTNPKDKVSEAEYIRLLLMDAGVAAEDIITETKARNTAENVSFSKRLIDSMHAAPPYVVITSAFHIRRSAMAFKKENMEVIMYPSAYIAVQKKLNIDDYLLPKTEILNKWRSIIKEIFGVWVYQLTGKA
jgi:uncharacterized SAM-binding protein YcdF (DUF218 family)